MRTKVRQGCAKIVTTCTDFVVCTTTYSPKPRIHLSYLGYLTTGIFLGNGPYIKLLGEAWMEQVSCKEEEEKDEAWSIRLLW